ncbi:hypothetical protein [Dokdonella soli]|uniref:DUF3077 domain-containing protein n=1 Tax=Dokdonella soli TaxID=529810 RepID=A0ABN1ID11_9GAMM
MNHLLFPPRRAHVRACSAAETAALFLVRVAIDAAREQLDRYALLTDDPLPGIVEAADLIDTARQRMTP